ncbi:MAG: class GN sortase [Granulosicoccus sp.]
MKTLFIVQLTQRSARLRSDPHFRHRSLQAIAACALVLATLAGSNAVWLSSKAILAQYLLGEAWRHSLASENTVKPWSWADVRTVAKLDIPSLGRTLIVLSDASGEAMAFGPGLVAGDPELAATSTIVLGGHRDTHLAFLEHIQPGATFLLENSKGEKFQYILSEKRIVDTKRETIGISALQPGLVLITCYPFKSLLTGGRQRLVVTARQAN